MTPPGCFLQCPEFLCQFTLAPQDSLTGTGGYGLPWLGLSLLPRLPGLTHPWPLPLGSPPTPIQPCPGVKWPPMTGTRSTSAQSMEAKSRAH